MTVTVKHSKTNAISDWTQAQLDEQIALGNFAEGTVLADIVLPSDWNDDHTLTGVGTMAEQDANNVAITGGSINGTTIGAVTASTGKFTSVTTPSVTATTTDLTLSAISTGAVKFNTLGGLQAQVTDVASADSYVNLSGGVGIATVAANSASGNVDLRLDSRASGNIRLRTAGGTEQARVSHTASAVNYVQVTGAATNGQPVISAQGSDVGVGLTYRTKSTNAHRFQDGSGNNGFIVSPAGSANYFQVTSSATTLAPIFSAQGSDTNISMAFQPKGTGAINLAAGSRGVNISNGGTVTAITRTATGSGYTTIPSVVITAPTTAGGVQATATVTAVPFGNSPTITSGGTGYTVGDVLTFVGGTFTGLSNATVTSVSAGVITGINYTNYAQYSVLPTNPISVTGGTGTGATFTINNYNIGSIFTITNAGSGYIEQPTITFSGGGGSGAAAYATVGSGTVVRSLGINMDFYTPTTGIGFRIADSQAGTTTPSYFTVNGNNNNAFLNASGGSGANVGMYYISKGTGQHSFTTNASSVNEQFRVAHTASAVNYVQVTGATTLNPPAITAQGSDANIPLAIASKGTSGVRLQTAGSTSQAIINHIASAVNQIGISGNIAGSAPSLSAQGSDTNIDLALTPKGTGLVRFGTYVAGALTATGYINIKAADGTTYKVLVST